MSAVDGEADRESAVGVLRIVLERWLLGENRPDDDIDTVAKALAAARQEGQLGFELRYADLQREYTKLKAEHAEMTRELAPKRLERSIALDVAAGTELARRRAAGEPAISFDDIRAEYERTNGK